MFIERKNNSIIAAFLKWPTLAEKGLNPGKGKRQKKKTRKQANSEVNIDNI